MLDVVNGVSKEGLEERRTGVAAIGEGPIYRQISIGLCRVIKNLGGTEELKRFILEEQASWLSWSG